MRLLSRSRLLPVWVLLLGAHAWGAGPLFNILDYGARSDGATPSTEAIRSAIQAAKAAGRNAESTSRASADAAEAWKTSGSTT